MSKIPTSSRLPVPQRSGIPSRTLAATQSVSKSTDIENRNANNVPRSTLSATMAKPSSSDDRSVSSLDRISRTATAPPASRLGSTTSRVRSDDSSVGSAPPAMSSEPKFATTTSSSTLQKRSLSTTQTVRTSQQSSSSSSLRSTTSLTRPATTSSANGAVAASTSGPRSLFGGQRKATVSSSLNMDHIPSQHGATKRASPKPSPVKSSPSKHSPKNSPGKKTPSRPPMDPVKQLQMLSKRADMAREICFSEKQELVDRIFSEEEDPALTQLIKDNQWIAPNVTMQTFLRGNRLQDTLVQTTNTYIKEIGGSDIMAVLNAPDTFDAF